MTQSQYDKQNAKGYEGDSFVHEEIKKLVERFKVDLIVETGTYRGATTRRLAEFSEVWTYEIDKANYLYSAKLLNEIKGIDVKIGHGNSVDYLSKYLPGSIDRSMLFFLDSHWGEYWPLLDELLLIAGNGLKPVIVIHDFKVPGKDFGFDSYKGVDLDFNYIKESIEAIYGPEGYEYHYNEKADGARRGLIYIYPKLKTYEVKDAEVTSVSLVEESPFGKAGNFSKTSQTNTQ